METVEAGRPLDFLEHGPPRGPRRPAPRSLLVTGLLVGTAMLVPAAYLLVRAAQGGRGAAAETLLDGRTLGLLVRTSALAIAVTATTIVLGVAFAWLVTRSDLPGRRAWTVLAALPLVIPTYVGGYVFVAALGPRGLVQRWLEPLGVERLPSMYGFPGALLVLSLFTFPYVFLTVRAALRGIDPALEEASTSLGCSRRRTFRRVVLPQLRPAIVAGALLVALYVLHDFGAVSLLRFDSFTRAIYLQYQGSFDRSRAALLALVLVALTLVVLALEARTRSGGQYHGARAGASRVAPVVPLGRWRWPVFLACSVVVALALLLPLGVIGYWLVRGVRAGETVGFAFAAAANSVRVSALGAATALLAAWPVAVLGARHPGRFHAAIERASFVGYALPGLVVALSLVFFGARYLPALYQTVPLLAFAYVVLFLPQAAGALRASLLQVNPVLEEAAHSLGSTRFQTLRRVVLPLVRPGALAGLALVFLTAMKELPATLLLSPTGFSTLATEVWSAANSAAFARAAAPSLLLIGVAALSLGVLLSRSGRAAR